MDDEEKITPEGCRYRIIKDIAKWREKNQSPKNKCGTKEYFKEYYYERGGKEIFSKIHAKRHRNLKWIPLFLNPFPDDIEIDYHHINNLLVIPLPTKLHRINCKTTHKEDCNYLIRQIYCLDAEKIFNP